MARRISPIHPFPARMAPEIVLSRLENLPKDAIIADPMSGSGTVLRTCTERGHDCYGFDLDPLAVLMARVWTTPLDIELLNARALKLVKAAKSASWSQLPWVESCAETVEFIEYWFAPKQMHQLRRLARVLECESGKYADALRIALSRTIVTKERGASIARDTSHSRPHRVFFDNDYDVFEGFIRSVNRLGQLLHPDRLRGDAKVRLGDARSMSSIGDGTVDAVVTSPPYLNAIDYLRGHRMALVWFGHNLSDLRKVRQKSIGTEATGNCELSSEDDLVRDAGRLRELPDRQLRMVKKYAFDTKLMLTEVARIVRPGGKVVLVVGDSYLRGVAISNAAIIISAGKSVGLRLRHSLKRSLPTRNRYLPLPSRKNRDESLSLRMRNETVLTFSN